jgi:DNA-binding transcriptional regulator YiaG
MPNLSQVLKSEIIRISRKEINASVKPLRSSNFILKRTIAELKKRIAALENENRRFQSLSSKIMKTLPPAAPEEMDRVRITARSIKKLRGKLGLSQDNFAKLLGVSSQAVYAMEHRQGRLKLRPATLSNLIAVRGMGKREAARKLEEM